MALFCLEKNLLPCNLPLQQWMTMKELLQLLMILQPWLRPPKTSTGLAGAPLHENTPGATAVVGLNVPALVTTARAQRPDEHNAAAEAASQHNELQRY
mmetsp:Transcript_25984/g.38194  ORF Transcript_25984/g.38194 Transcript_25984/m.38194 type:complete len:98 (+) Transcript_25984:51-344(+)